MMNFRDARSDDIGGILAVQRAAPSAACWEAGDYVRALHDRNSLCLLAEHSVYCLVVGFLLARTLAGEFEILNLAVRPEYRQQGIGRRLLEDALARAKNRGAQTCWLEVRSTNQTARVFYQALGFVENGRRVRYYRNPDDDAVVYIRPVVAAEFAP